MGNPKPVFRIKRASVAEMRPFGKDKNHVEVSISCFETGARARAFDFFRRVEDFTVLPLSGAEVDIVGTLVRDSFRGPRALAVRIVDILESRD
jgi:single-stranded DNA-specific DHH superfamily exonuclease